jgi:hypothetical protein
MVRQAWIAVPEESGRLRDSQKKKRKEGGICYLLYIVK